MADGARHPALHARQLTDSPLWAEFKEDVRLQARSALQRARDDEALRHAAHAARGIESVIQWLETVARADELPAGVDDDEVASFSLADYLEDAHA